MMLSAPSPSICCCTDELIPWPIASSQITLATPTKIPKIVSSDRSGCRRKLRTPIRQARSRTTIMSRVLESRPGQAAEALPKNRSYERPIAACRFRATPATRLRPGERED